MRPLIGDCSLCHDKMMDECPHCRAAWQFYHDLRRLGPKYPKALDNLRLLDRVGPRKYERIKKGGTLKPHYKFSTFARMDNALRAEVLVEDWAHTPERYKQILRDYLYA